MDAETLSSGRLGQLGGGVFDVGFATAEDDGGCAVCGGKTLLALERVQRRPGLTGRLTFEEHVCDSLADTAASASLSSCAQDQDRDDVGAETSRGQRDCSYHESDFSAKDVLAKYRVLGRHSRCVSVANEKGAPFSHRRPAKVRRAASARARAGGRVDQRKG